MKECKVVRTYINDRDISNGNLENLLNQGYEIVWSNDIGKAGFDAAVEYVLEREVPDVNNIVGFTPTMEVI